MSPNRLFGSSSDVEDLLYKIEKTFYTKSRAEINGIKDRLRQMQLSDFKNTAEYSFNRCFCVLIKARPNIYIT